MYYNKKVDVFSGILVKLYDVIKELCDNVLFVYDRYEKIEKRIYDEIGIYVVCGGMIVGEYDILFVGIDEIIIILYKV